MIDNGSYVTLCCGC